MSTAVGGVNAVSEAKDSLGETIVVLKSALNYGAVQCSRDIDRRAMADLPVSVEMADEAGNTAFKVESLLTVFSFVPEGHFQPLV
ncbi:hypothetical protein ES703_46435 [subsurface metagenome]